MYHSLLLWFFAHWLWSNAWRHLKSDCSMNLFIALITSISRRWLHSRRSWHIGIMFKCIIQNWMSKFQSYVNGKNCNIYSVMYHKTILFTVQLVTLIFFYQLHWKWINQNQTQNEVRWCHPTQTWNCNTPFHMLFGGAPKFINMYSELWHVERAWHSVLMLNKVSSDDNTYFPTDARISR